MDHDQLLSTPQQTVDFDTRPPVPVNQYEHTVRRVNVGYDLLFTITHAFLRALRQADLELLVVGAGGGAEIESFLPTNPAWRMTGVDPSDEMLAIARAKAEQHQVRDRVTLLRGTVDELPNDARFDAAVCLFVLHFLPDEAKLTALRGIHRRLRPRAPLLVACGARMAEDVSLRDDYLGAWQQFGELMGMPAERMAALIQQILAQQAASSTEEEYVRLMHEAGFEHVGSVLRVMGGGMAAWLAR